MAPIPSDRPESTADHRTRSGSGSTRYFEYENYHIIKADHCWRQNVDLDIEIADNTITIRGSRKQTDTVPDNQYIQECFGEILYRTVTLPVPSTKAQPVKEANKESISKFRSKKRR